MSINSIADAVASLLKENMEGFNEALEKAQKSFLGTVQNLEGKTDEQTAKVAGNTSYMEAAVGCFAENLTSVNEGLEGLSVSDHKRNMASALAHLIEKFETFNEVLEGPYIPDLKRNMATPEASSTENLPSLMEALEKAKKLLLQRVQNLEGKIDEQRELSTLNEGTKCNTASAVGSLTENLLNEALEGLSVSDNKRKRAAELASLKERIQSINEVIEESNKSWSQRNPIIAEKKDKPQVGGLTLEYLRTGLEYSQKVNEDCSEWLQNLKGMHELMINLVEGFSVSDHKRNMAAALASLIEKFGTVNEALEGPSIPDLKHNMATPEASSTENLPSLKEALEKAKKLLLQRVQNLEGKKDEQREVSSLNEGTKCNTASLTENLLNESLEGLSVSDDKRKRAAELASLKERIQSINEAIEESIKSWSQRNPIIAEKKDKPRVGGLTLEYIRTGLEYSQKVNEDFSEWFQNRKGIMDELMKNQEDIVAGMSHSDPFADQFDLMEYGIY